METKRSRSCIGYCPELSLFRKLVDIQFVPNESPARAKSFEQENFDRETSTTYYKDLIVLRLWKVLDHRYYTIGELWDCVFHEYVHTPHNILLAIDTVSIKAALVRRTMARSTKI